MLALLLASAARAACALEQTTTADGVEIVVRALAEPVGCRTLALSAAGAVEVKAEVWSPEGRRTRLDAHHRRQLPGGGWEIGAPELEVGGWVRLETRVTGGDLEVRLAPAPENHLRVERVDEVHALTLDARHPGWGFADPTRAQTRISVAARFPPDAPAQVLPIPEDAADIDAGGLDLVPNGVAIPAGVVEARVAYTLAGASPQGLRTLAPGSLTLLGSGVAWRTRAGAGVTATPVEGGVRFDAPAGGQVRWRVERAGDAAVIPDVDTFVAGIDYRFARGSLPEPAVPVELRGRRDRGALFLDLLAAVRGLRTGALPGTEPLLPRPLNRAWRSGWATPVEQGLVLHRFLGQERFRAAWALTGVDADAETLTGFDHLLVAALVDGAVAWVDPACDVCAPGEIGTAWFGRPMVGLELDARADARRYGVPAKGSAPAEGAAIDDTIPPDTAQAANAPWRVLPAGATVPRGEGRLERRLALVGDRFEARFLATGAAALWLRERLAGVEPAVRGARIASALGMPDATLVASSGFEQPGEPIEVELEADRPPQDPFPDTDATPWAGGWGEAP